MSLKKSKFDDYLEEINKQFIAIKGDDFKRSQKVFQSVFNQVKAKMGEQCKYFNKYSSEVLFGGSVYDGTKISKMDEFDMDVVIRLPINYEEGENGIIIENDQPGFVRLKIINAFDNLDKQQHWESCHKVTRDWRDDSKYFLQSKFRHWLHKVIQKALNEMQGRATVEGVNYLLNFKETGPAYTLNIRNEATDQNFKLDVDIVPVIRFMYPRWPKGYRTLAICPERKWLVVPKPNKGITNEMVKGRCWRLSFQDHEREILREQHNLKKIIRLMKKMRDALNMKCIASYYIKTLFLWKIENVKNKEYWQNNLTVLFTAMLVDLYNAIKSKNIPYYWMKTNNLIEGMKPGIQEKYAGQLKAVLDSVQANDIDKTLNALLTTEEIKQFKTTEFYNKRISLTVSQPLLAVQRCRSEAVMGSKCDPHSEANSRVDGQMLTQNNFITMMAKFEMLMRKFECLEERIIRLEDSVTCLVMANNTKR